MADNTMPKLNAHQWEVLLAYRHNPDDKLFLPLREETGSQLEQLGYATADKYHNGFYTITDKGREVAENLYNQAVNGNLNMPARAARALAYVEPNLMVESPSKTAREIALSHVTSLSKENIERFAKSDNKEERFAALRFSNKEQEPLFDNETNYYVITRLEYKFPGWTNRHLKRLLAVQDSTVLEWAVAHSEPDDETLDWIIEHECADSVVWNKYGERTHRLTKEQTRRLLEHGEPRMVNSYLCHLLRDNDPRRELLDDELFDLWAEQCSPELIDQMQREDVNGLTPERIDAYIERGDSDMQIARLGNRLTDDQVDALLEHASSEICDTLLNFSTRPYTERQLRLLDEHSDEQSTFRTRLNRLARKLYAMSENPTNSPELFRLISEAHEKNGETR